MKSETDKLIEAPGIVAAAKHQAGQTELRVSEGDAQQWALLLEAARQVLDASSTDEVKITLDQHTVVLLRSGVVVLGVVVVKPHPVVKSLKRMLRRAFKRMEGASAALPVRDAGSGVPSPVSDPTASTTKLDL
jgi:hypothetical protein